MTETSTELVKRISAAAQGGDAAAVRQHLGNLRAQLENGVPLDHVDAHDLVEALTKVAGSAAGVDGGRSPYELIEEIRKASGQTPIDRKAMRKAWGSLAPFLTDASVMIEANATNSLMDSLRSARSFDLLNRSAESLIARGDGSARTRRLYGQALIETEHPSAAIDVLTTTLQHADLPQEERDEVQGLLGRAHKQIYVDHVRSAAAGLALRGRFGAELTRAIAHYAAAFDPQNAGHNYWQGINLVALLRLAKADGVSIPQGLDAEAISRSLVTALEGQTQSDPDPWKLATVGEAYLALGNLEKAGQYLGQFARSDKVDAFLLSGTVRQLEQVWRIKAGSGGAGPILAALKAALAAKEGSVITLDGVERQLLSLPESSETRRLFETTVPGGKFVQLAVLQSIVRCGSAVAAIRSPAFDTIGTGFLLNGKDLCDDLENAQYLLTNAHVLWDAKQGPGDQGALAPGQAKISFETEAKDGTTQLYSCEKEAVWQSPSSEFDATLVKLTKPVAHITPLKVSDGKKPLVVEDAEKGVAGTSLAVLGHPKGGNLAISVLGDLTKMSGTLVDMGPRSTDASDPVYLRYRTPTEPGNSGSPVFETDSWNVVALHHAGFDPDSGRPRLAGKPGRDLANEGIAIESIRRSLREKLRGRAWGKRR